MHARRDPLKPRLTPCLCHALPEETDVYFSVFGKTLSGPNMSTGAVAVLDKAMLLLVRVQLAKSVSPSLASGSRIYSAPYAPLFLAQKIPLRLQPRISRGQRRIHSIARARVADLTRPAVSRNSTFSSLTCIASSDHSRASSPSLASRSSTARRRRSW